MATVNSYNEVLNNLNKMLHTNLGIEDIYCASYDCIIRIEEPYCRQIWESLKKAVMSQSKLEFTKDNQSYRTDIKIRSHGKNASGSNNLQNILKSVFGRDFQIDSSNNSLPKWLLEKCCGSDFQDYQISHIFEERTNNPLLFGAPWMLCLTPKILDPFTGHETKGFPKLKKVFIEDEYKKNEDYINDYNNLAYGYWRKLQEYFSKNNIIIKECDSRSLEKGLVVALAPIIKEYELLPAKEKKLKYVDLFCEQR